MIYVSDDHCFHLSNGRISYAFRVSAEGLLEHVHFGGAVPDLEQFNRAPRRVFRACALEFESRLNYSLEDIPQEYPVFGRSDNRTPALHVINADGNSTISPRYKSHTTSESKPQLGDLPSARQANSQTLTITLEDAVYGLLVDLHYTVYAEHDVITRSTTLRNTGSKPIVLKSVQSTSLDLGTDAYDILHFRGSWSREFHTERHRLEHAKLVIESNRGTSSNAHNPCLIATEPSTTETHGKSYSFALMYSGNHAFSVERGEFESVRVTAGISAFNFSWQLAGGDTFHAPEIAQVYSDAGLTGMSHIWHAFINKVISPLGFSGAARPTYLNSWEAHYFDVNETAVLELAKKAKALGLEMLVLDDGWFAGRNDDTSSLGDWFADSKKFPNGIPATAKRVRELGLKFGLWFEPEMVNERSELFAKHPDWILKVPHRNLSTGRQQYTLDLSNDLVTDYLYDRIADFLSSGQIDYIKWDMNRTMSELGSPLWPQEQQQEVAHRYILGLYRLVRKVTESFPRVIFENCASGGNRVDLGMLAFMSQSWISDMSEPIGRLPIINGASHIFPLATMAAYIGPVPSHQNGRQVSIKTRAEASFFCAARGLSLNEADLAADSDELRFYIDLYKATAQDIVAGLFYRLKNTANEVVWQLNSADASRVYLGYFHILSGVNLPLKRICLQGLEPSATYTLTHPQWSNEQPQFSGSELLQRGFDLPHVDAMRHQPDRVDYRQFMPVGDFASMLLVFKKQ